MSAAERVREYLEALCAGDTSTCAGFDPDDLRELLAGYVGAEHVPVIRRALLAQQINLGPMDSPMKDRVKAALAALPKED